MRSESLPDEVMLDILLRLPVKSLKRFKCVCRSWCSNFEDPDFVREHYRTNCIRGINLQTLMSIPRYSALGLAVNFSLLSNETTRVQETINTPNFGLTMVNECEGLILLCHWIAMSNFLGPEDPFPILLLNPATHEVKTLTHSYIELPPLTDLVQSISLSLGYDSRTGDYKVVRFVNIFWSTLQVELYTLSSNSWRLIPAYQIPIHYRGDLGLPTTFSIYLNGNCYWWLIGWEYILAFDMTQETFRLMGFPSCSDFSLCCWELMPELEVFNNSLAVFLHSREKMGCFEIWVMKECGDMSSWTKQLVIGPISGVEEELLGRWKLLGMWKTGEFFFQTDEGRLVSYRPQTEAIMDLEIFIYGFTRYTDFGFRVFIFTGSLFSLSGR